MIEKIHIFEDWATMGHRVIVRGRPYPGASVHILMADGSWEPITEMPNGIEPVGGRYGFTLPEGTLDAIVQERLKIAAPQQSTERHLTDAIEVRDRLLTLLEGRRK